MAEWTFLTNHALVLIFLARHSSITARELSFSIGITERAVRRIIADLDSGGYIEKTRKGNRITYAINSELPFRHHTQRDRAVGSLLRAVGWEPRVIERRDDIPALPKKKTLRSRRVRLEIGTPTPKQAA